MTLRRRSGYRIDSAHECHSDSIFSYARHMSSLSAAWSAGTVPFTSFDRQDEPLDFGPDTFAPVVIDRQVLFVVPRREMLSAHIFPLPLIGRDRVLAVHNADHHRCSGFSPAPPPFGLGLVDHPGYGKSSLCKDNFRTVPFTSCSVQSPATTTVEVELSRSLVTCTNFKDLLKAVQAVLRSDLVGEYRNQLCCKVRHDKVIVQVSFSTSARRKLREDALSIAKDAWKWRAGHIYELCYSAWS